MFKNSKHQQSVPAGGSKRPDLQDRLGIVLGKILSAFIRLSGRGGTTLPGRAALKVAPAIMEHLAGQLREGSVVVTGTNGKTTTTALISAMLKQTGCRPVHNQSGSNMTWGVVSSFLDASTWGGRLSDDFAVMESDEGAFPEVVRRLQPRGAVVTNIFRDQLDRFGEIDHIQKTLQRGLERVPVQGFHVLNADDPSLAGLCSGWPGRRWFYGLELDLPPDRFRNTARDIKSCPRCHTGLDYSRVYFAHLGHYRCPVCAFTRPEPDVKLVARAPAPEGATALSLLLPEGEMKLIYPLPGTYNLYNALAAVTCGLALGLGAESIAAAVAGAAPSFGRMERFTMEGRTLLMALIKNPVGVNEVMRTLLEREAPLHLVIAINDLLADGTDVSWLWDADFEQLAMVQERLHTVIVTGIRAWDMAVRLKYAGVDEDRLTVQESFRKAIAEGLRQTPPGETLFVLPTYTAMLEMRRLLNRMGVGRPFWETVRHG